MGSYTRWRDRQRNYLALIYAQGCETGKSYSSGYNLLEIFPPDLESQEIIRSLHVLRWA